MIERAGPLAEISVRPAEISATGTEKFPYKHAIPLAGMKTIRVSMRKSQSLTKCNAETKMADSRSDELLEEVPAEISTNKPFKWNPDMIEHLIDKLQAFKTKMAYKGIDFDGDKAHQYKEIRLAMAKEYEGINVSYFGPSSISRLPDNFKELSKVQQTAAKRIVKDSSDKVSRGTKRVIEKVKEIRQRFSKAVVSGSRSGSGKIVYEFYDKLITLWGGSANIQPLPFGVQGDDFHTISHDPISPDNDSDITSQENNTSDDAEKDEDNDSADDSDVEPHEDVGKKRKSTSQKSCVPVLIDNKRKHLEKNLSAAQRDQLLFKEAKEDAQFRREMAQAMRESNETFAQGMKEISKAMGDFNAGICRSMEMLAKATTQPQLQMVQPPVNHNMFYQSPFAGPSHAANTQGYYSQMLNQEEQP